MALRLLKRSSTSLFSPKIESLCVNTITRIPILQSFYALSTVIEKPSCKVTNYLIFRHHISPEAAASAASVLKGLKSLKNPDLILDYLKETGLSKTQLEDLLLCDPRFLSINFNKAIKPKIMAMQKLGFSNFEFASFLSSVPALFTIPRSPARVISSFNVLKSLLGSNVEVVKLLRVCDWFLASDLERTMLPNVELLLSCGVSLMQIRQLVFNFPRFFLIKTENLRDFVRQADEMGLSRDSKMYVHGIRAISSMSTEKWELKLELFRKLGFSNDDVLSVFRRTPQIFAISERKIKEVTELLINSGNVDVSFVVQHPELLIYSAKCRVKPRLLIVNILLSKGLLRKKPSLTSVCKMDHEMFVRKYVVPYVTEIGEVGEKFMATKRSVDVGHPVSSS